LLKKFDEKRNDFVDEITEFSLDEFILEHATPLVMKFDQKVAQKIFSDKKPGLFLYRDPNSEKSDSLNAIMLEVAKELKGAIQVVVSGISEGFETRLAEYIGVTSKDLPTVRIHDTTKDLKKFNMDGEITKENIIKFVKDWQKDLIQPSYKSEPMPDNQDGPVFIMVGKEFDKVVFDETKDVLIEFYAPWCGHCKQLAPIYDELGKRLKHNPNLVIAKMDATVNETSKVSVTGYPTIKFFKATDKSKPIDYSGGRDSADAFIQFLKTNAAFPFTDSEAKTEL